MTPDLTPDQPVTVPPARRRPLLAVPARDGRRRVDRVVRRALAATAAFAVAQGVAFFLQPGTASETALGRSLSGPVDDAWNGCYVAGGLLMLVGLAVRRPGLAVNTERIGLQLMLAAMLVNALAIIHIGGLGSRALLPFVLFGAVLIGRLQDLRDTVREAETEVPTTEQLAVLAIPLMFAAGADFGTLAIAILSGGGAIALTTAYNARRTGRLIDAQAESTRVTAASTAADIANQAAVRVVERLEAEIDRLATENDRLRRRVTELEQHVDALEQRTDS